uniref:Uncharacterized protein n=1 Tax=Chrysotila carterae TaxID=13221 RepID=A0A7S4B3Z7_CHRCT|mmetsp:Transcript_8723/g.18908  ORF Transcript_8723/g.18908 Transcript_8723/m.18908 type:complete len:246 (-) Transcript_8723:470-1207(-)
MNLFGRKKQPELAVSNSASSGGNSGSNTTAAIAKLRDASETLEKREEHLIRKIDMEIKQARTFNAAGKKREALTCIKRKKMYEKQLEQISGAKMTLETQRLALENVNINRETLEAQRLGAAAMSAATKQMGGVEAVEETMDSVEEGLQDADEIGQAMARSVNTGLDQDDDELLAELEGLEQDDLDATLTSVAPSSSKASDEEAELEKALMMPTAPLNAPSAPKTAARPMTDEERELAELEASMAM